MVFCRSVVEGVLEGMRDVEFSQEDRSMDLNFTNQEIAAIGAGKLLKREKRMLSPTSFGGRVFAMRVGDLLPEVEAE